MNLLINFLVNRNNDLTTFFIPRAYFFKQAILGFHQIPLWNPVQFSGLPYLADPQNFIFYPPSYIFLFLSVETAFVILLVVHIILAGVGTYYLARQVFKLRYLTASVTALIFVLTPKLFSHLEAGHYSMIIAFSWLPWFLLTTSSSISKPTLRKSLLLSIISFFLYINYINIAYFAILFFCGYSLFAFIIKHQLRQNFLKYFLFFAVYFLVFLGLISPNLLAQVEFGPLSTRYQITYADVAQPIWSFKLFFQNLFFPFLLDREQLSTERVLFPGITVWILATFGWLNYRPRYKWFYLTWLIFSLLFALGARIPFFIFFYKFFPFIRWMRITTRLWIISNLIIALFAGLGLEKLFLAKKTPLLIFFSYILIPLCIFELMLVNTKIFSRPINDDKIPASFYEIMGNDKNQPDRVYCPTGCFSLQKLGEMGITAVNGNDPMQLAAFVEYLAKAGNYQYSSYIPVLPPYETFALKPQPNAYLLGQLNVKYVASPYKLLSNDWLLTKTAADFFLYQNKKQKTVWLNNGGEASLENLSPNKIIVNITNSKDNLLILSEMFYPGWSATDQNGAQLEIIDAKPFRAVKITPTTQKVFFSYWPASLTISLTIFFTTLITIIYACCYPQFFHGFSRARYRNLRG